VREAEALSFVSIGFSMLERAWTLRGMENLLVDMYENPAFVGSLLDRITEYHLALIDRALRFNLDGFRFGDDWGQQNWLIMGPRSGSESVLSRTTYRSTGGETIQQELKD